MISSRSITVLFFLVAIVSRLCAGEAAWVSDKPRDGDFPLVQNRVAVPILFSGDDAKVVEIAARDLAADIERVTGVKVDVTTVPVVARRGSGGILDGENVVHPSTGMQDPCAPAQGHVARRGNGGTNAVLIGTLGQSPLIDGLVASGRLDVSALRGQWETFLITTVAAPLPGVAQALVIVGSDRRGTAYGVYELSQAIGVSPWYWWADVVPEKKAELWVAAGTRKFGPPSVQYRGIFINDEDWGLQPWAAQTFSPEDGGIGPKVYRKVFELLLRLKANTLWPAMHACTKAFNSFPENARLADDYAIVMGSSHAEPMLRNNVREWTAPKEDYNYLANPDGVRRYWEERVAANGRFESIYTLGMRGIHDSNMVGPKTDAERIATLERIFADQRALIAKHVKPEVEQVPQMFCAYKEVLNLYRQGLKVPDDVTIVWPDDNFGYVRNFASAEEQKRSGGFGVYYHISYLGRPLAYLWLCTTPPALIWEEMSKAYDHGARKLWIVNVGDIKPAEIGTEFFLQMAWDINRWGRDCQPRFLEEWATREFGAASAKEIAGIMADYYQLNYQRKPEHLQWWLPGTAPTRSPMVEGESREARSRLTAFSVLEQRTIYAAGRARVGSAPAFAELVEYPVKGAAIANLRFLLSELGAVASVNQVHRELLRITAEFDASVAGGKWRHLMHLEPADDQWKGMRIAPWEARWPESEKEDDVAHQTMNYRDAQAPVQSPAGSFAETNGVVSLEAEHFDAKADRSGAGWQVIPGLGRTGEGSVAVFPTTAPPVPSSSDAARTAPRLEYSIWFFTAGEFTLHANLIPTHPISGEVLRFAVALDDEAQQLVELPFKDGSPDWAQGVLNNTRVATAKLKVAAPGPHTLRVYGLEAGVVIDKLVIDCGGLKPSYLGPPETRVVPVAK